MENPDLVLAEGREEIGLVFGLVARSKEPRKAAGRVNVRRRVVARHHLSVREKSGVQWSPEESGTVVR